MCTNKLYCFILGLVRLSALGRMQDGFVSIARDVADAESDAYFGDMEEVAKYSRVVLVSCRYELCTSSLLNRSLYKQPVYGNMALRSLGNSSIQFENKVNVKTENGENGKELYTHFGTLIGVGKISYIAKIVEPN